MTILAGLSAIFDRHLEVEGVGSAPHYRHRASALRLSASRPDEFDARQLLEEAYGRLVSNLECSPRFAARGPSPENWRLSKQLGDSPRNSSPEVTLERAIARAAGLDWFNQVPAASGLWEAATDKRCAVDLVRRAADRTFELVELKVRSDTTPLGAAIEIVQYGLLYFLAREWYPEARRTRNELLQANEVRLRVLALKNYYASYNLEWLAHDLDVGLRGFAFDRFGGLVMSFCFDAFPNDFCWPCAASDLVDALQNRRRVWPSEPTTLNEATG